MGLLFVKGRNQPRSAEGKNGGISAILYASKWVYAYFTGSAHKKWKIGSKETSGYRRAEKNVVYSA